MYTNEEVRGTAAAMAIITDHADCVAWLDFLKWPEDDDAKEQEGVAYARGLVQAAMPPHGKLHTRLTDAISGEMGFRIDGATCYDLASRLLHVAGSPADLLEGLAMSMAARKALRELGMASLEDLDEDEIDEITTPWGEASRCNHHPVTMRVRIRC